MKINTFDIDGVIDFGDTYTGVRPCVNDIIITGRSVHSERDVAAGLEIQTAQKISTGRKIAMIALLDANLTESVAAQKTFI